MRHRLFTLGVVVAAIAAGGILDVPTASAAPASHFWFGYAGSSAVADALAEDLIQGKSVQQARLLANELSPLTTPATAAVIGNELDRATTGGSSDTAASLLNYTPPSGTHAAGRKSDIVAPDFAAAGIDAAAATTNSAAVPEATSEPKQATDGDPKATSLYEWLFHNNSATPIFYGECSPSSCTTGGYFVVNDSANVVGPPTVSFSSIIKQGGGQGAAFSNSTVRIFDDESGKSDPDEYSTTCAVAGGNTKISCTLFPEPSVTIGSWYYYRQDFTACTAIAGCGDIQIQTRRWKVVNSQEYELIAYEYGG
jgi:hypothetical protein